MTTFRVYDRNDEYDTVEAVYAEDHPDGISFHGPDGELVGWYAKDMLRGFCAVREV